MGKKRFEFLGKAQESIKRHAPAAEKQLYHGGDISFPFLPDV